MNYMFFDQWKHNRVKKVVDVLGKDWFIGKDIHEFGCAHGEVGEEFLKMGARVDFSDIRKENLDSLWDRLYNIGYKPKNRVVNQDSVYDLGKHYDLLLHFGTLYTLENWEQDLECAMKHSNMMFLESVVLPESGIKSIKTEVNSPFDKYASVKNLWSMNTAGAIEQHLSSIGCKYLRFDDRNLNSHGWVDQDYFMNNLYDWKEDQHDYQARTINNITLYRRMWLVLK